MQGPAEPSTFGWIVLTSTSRLERSVHNGGMVRRRTSFTGWEGLAFCIGMIGVQLASELIIQWGSYFYAPPPGAGRAAFVSIGLVGAMFVAGRVFDIVIDPLIGTWSDNTGASPSKQRLGLLAGRRRPFLFWGALLSTVTGIAFWFPPDSTETVRNFVYGTVLLCIHWMFYTLCYVPFHALAPEVATSGDDRIRLGRWIAVGMTLGVVVANVLPGALVATLDPSPPPNIGNGTALASPAGFQRVAIFFSLAALACFLFPAFAIRERHRPQTDPLSRGDIVGDIRAVFRDKAFVRFFLITVLFNIGYLAGQRVIPYWAVVGLGGTEATVTELLIPFVITCLLTSAVLPSWAKRHNPRFLLAISLAILGCALPMLHGIGAMPGGIATKVLAGQGLMGVVGVAQGMLYVLPLPLLGQIIDSDTAKTGRRREAVYNGVYAVAWKAGAVLSIMLSTQTMDWLGNSKDSPLGVLVVGPIGGAFAWAAFALNALPVGGHPTGTTSGQDPSQRERDKDS